MNRKGEREKSKERKTCVRILSTIANLAFEALRCFCCKCAQLGVWADGGQSGLLFVCSGFCAAMPSASLQHHSAS